MCVPVELSALGSTGIVPRQLVSSVNPSHVLVVQQNCFRTADGSVSVVLLFFLTVGLSGSADLPSGINSLAHIARQMFTQDPYCVCVRGGDMS